VLKEGDKAPGFSLESDSGKHVSLADFAGKTLVLYFYPRDNTPGCTRQAQAFTAARTKIERAGGAVVGVSRDSVKSHLGFRDKHRITFPLLSDPDLAVHKAYGAWGEKTMYGKKLEGVLRSTFLVRNGRIVRVFPNVKVDVHAEQVLAALAGAPASPPPARSATKTEKTATAPKAKPTPKKKKAASARART
jgi:thioredoxin-dependent peroxiredoxin